MRKSPFIVSIPVLLSIIALSLTALLRPDWIVSTSSAPNPALLRRVEYGLWRKCVKTTKRHASNSLVGSSSSSSSLAASHDAFAELLGKDGGEGEGGEHEGGRSDPNDGSGDDPLRLGQWVCEPFPTRSECEAKGTRSFCVLWSAAGYLGLVSLIPHLVSCVAVFIIAVGLGERQVRKSRRKRGWKGIAACSLVAGLLQVVTFSIIVHVFRTDPARFERAPGASSRFDASLILFLVSTVLSFVLFSALTFTGLQARAGKVWAGGMSVRGKGKRRAASGHRAGSRRATAARTVDEEAPLLAEESTADGA